MKYLLKIAQDFSTTPGGRYINDGPFSAELFYRDLLKDKFGKALKEHKSLTIDLDGTYGFAISFLHEVFTRLIKDFSPEEVNEHINLISLDEPYLIDEIKAFMHDSYQTAH